MDTVYHLFSERRLEREQVIDHEIKQWLGMLLQIIKIPGKHTIVSYKLFIEGRKEVLKEYKQFLQESVSSS